MATVEITIAQNKSYDPVKFHRNRVKVIVNQDDQHGVWIDENLLFNLFDKSQKKRYLTVSGPKGSQYKVSYKVAQKVIHLGQSPSGKPQIAPPEPPPLPKLEPEPKGPSPEDLKLAELSGWFTDLDNVRKFL